MRRAQRRRQEKGVAAVEFALVAPFLVFLLIGLWEVGRMIDAFQLLNNACREAGRQASSGSKTLTQIEQSFVNYLKGVGVPTAGYTFSCSPIAPNTVTDPTQADQLGHYRISATLPIANVKWFSGSFYASGTSLSTTVDWYSMRDVPFTISTTIPIN